LLVELTMVEQRYLAVREVLDSGAKIGEVATRYGVDRRTMHHWLVRYASEGLGALADRSSQPGSLLPIRYLPSSRPMSKPRAVLSSGR
jgi:transposase-like protein